MALSVSPRLGEPALFCGTGEPQYLFIQQVFTEHLLYTPDPIMGSEDPEINQSDKILPCIVQTKELNLLSFSVLTSECYEENEQGRRRVGEEEGRVQG